MSKWDPYDEQEERTKESVLELSHSGTNSDYCTGGGYSKEVITVIQSCGQEELS